jgi:hypothetical protein
VGLLSGLLTMNTICVVLTPDGRNSQVLVNGVEISDCCNAIDIHCATGQQTEVIISLVGQVELLAEVARVIVEKESG